MTADTSPCSPEDFWSDEGTESAPLASSDPDPAPETARTPTVPAAAQDGRTTDRFDVADLRSCIDRLSKRALAAEAERDELSSLAEMDAATARDDLTAMSGKVAALELQRDEARAELRMRELHHFETEQENATLRAALARVEAVARRWESLGYLVATLGSKAAELRFALADPEPEQVQQADEAGA